MSDPHINDQAFEEFLQSQSRLPRLSADAKQNMLSALSVGSIRRDYTWPQFFLRLSSCVALLLCCIMLFHSFRAQDNASNPPTSISKTTTALNPLFPQASNIASHKRPINSPHSLMSYSLKGINHDH